MKRKLVYVEWADATRNSSWKTTSEATEWAELPDWIIRDCGWVVKRTKKYLCLASAWNPESDRSDEQFSNLVKIPKTWIRKYKVLKP